MENVSFDMDKKVKLLLCSGRLHYEKGIQLVLQAIPEIVRKIPSVQLMIVGSGPSQKSIDQLTGKLGLRDRVLLMGEIPHSKMVDYYNAADLYLMPSLRVEGLPLSLLEAMSCGKAVIASSIGGISSVFQDGVNGFLVQPNDLNGLISKVLELLSNEKLVAKLGRQARSDVMEKYNQDRMIKELETVLQEVVDRIDLMSDNL